MNDSTFSSTSSTISAGTPIADLKLCVRAHKRLTAIGVETAEKLAEMTAVGLMELKGFGATSLTDVREKLATIGLKLKGD